MVVGRIEALAIRPPSTPCPLAVDGVRALAGIGLEGDVHADRLWPRQVLLASAGVYADHDLPPHALGENLLLDADTAQLTSGTVLQVGADVRLRVMFQCEPCGYLDAHRPGLSGTIGRRRGILARVLAGGAIHPGDQVRDLGPLLPAWSDDWRERALRVLDAMPAGAVIDYAQLARLAGIQASYCRAMPGLLRRMGPVYSGRAVAAKEMPQLPRWRGDGLFDAASIV